MSEAGFFSRNKQGINSPLSGGVVLHITPAACTIRDRDHTLFKNGMNEPMNSLQRGFSMIEIMVVIMILAVMAVVIYPSVVNTLDKRNLESTAKEILTSMQRAKFQAVKAKLNHRVRFANESGAWRFYLEREDTPNNWSLLREVVRKTISTNFTVTIDLPSQMVVFSPLGVVDNYDANQNSVSLQSPKIAQMGQESYRHIQIMAGGSIQYTKSASAL